MQLKNSIQFSGAGFFRRMAALPLDGLHIVDGVEPQVVAGRLNVSRRQFCREQDAAIDAIAIIFMGALYKLPHGFGIILGSRQVPASSDRLSY